MPAAKKRKKPEQIPAAPKAVKVKPSRPAKKKGSGLAKLHKKRAARTVTKTTTVRQVVSNPPPLQDLVYTLLPGFGAYAVTRVLQRLAYTLVARKWPKLAKHAQAASGAVSFAGVWFIGHRIKKLAPYHDSILMGSGIAAVQGIGAAYLPKYGWLLNDCKPEEVAPKQLTAPAPARISAPAQAQEPAAGDEYGYLEEALSELERSGSRSARAVAPPKARNRPVAGAMQMAAGDDDGSLLDPDLFAELGANEDVDDLYSGPFQN